MDKIIAIAGPTAVGKTALSFYLADHYRTELISGDAYQIYKGHGYRYGQTDGR